MPRGHVRQIMWQMAGHVDQWAVALATVSSAEYVYASYLMLQVTPDAVTGRVTLSVHHTDSMCPVLMCTRATVCHSVMKPTMADISIDAVHATATEFKVYGGEACRVLSHVDSGQSGTLQCRILWDSADAPGRRGAAHEPNRSLLRTDLFALAPLLLKQQIALCSGHV
jgi:hypothetical protein